MQLFLITIALFSIWCMSVFSCTASCCSYYHSAY